MDLFADLDEAFPLKKRRSPLAVLGGVTVIGVFLGIVGWYVFLADAPAPVPPIVFAGPLIENPTPEQITAARAALPTEVVIGAPTAPEAPSGAVSVSYEADALSSPAETVDNTVVLTYDSVEQETTDAVVDVEATTTADLMLAGPVTVAPDGAPAAVRVEGVVLGVDSATGVLLVSGATGDLYRVTVAGSQLVIGQVVVSLADIQQDDVVIINGTAVSGGLDVAATTVLVTGIRQYTAPLEAEAN